VTPMTTPNPSLPRRLQMGRVRPLLLLMGAAVGRATTVIAAVSRAPLASWWQRGACTPRWTPSRLRLRRGVEPPLWGTHLERLGIWLLSLLQGAETRLVTAEAGQTGSPCTCQALLQLLGEQPCQGGMHLPGEMLQLLVCGAPVFRLPPASALGETDALATEDDSSCGSAAGVWAVACPCRGGGR
jgi:hypothetical protein